MNTINNIGLIHIKRYCWIIILTISFSFHTLANNRNSIPTCNINHEFKKHPIEYVNSNFENASPVIWEYNSDGSVQIQIIYDHERNSPNRASNHVHFQIQGKENSEVTIYIQYFDEVWNGKRVASYSLLRNYYISSNGINWETIPISEIVNGSHKLKIKMKSNSIYISGMEPYRISDLDRLYEQIQSNSIVNIEQIGKTVEGRSLEIIKIGNQNAPFRVFIRARAHPWEAGGNWVIQGLIKNLLINNVDKPKYLDKFCIYILPMANKDGVANGRTRFNGLGFDLNRQMNQSADPYYKPENAALEKWIKQMISKGLRPHIAIDIHNDRNGKILWGNPANVKKQEYLENSDNYSFSESYLIMDKNTDINHFNSNTRRFEYFINQCTSYYGEEGKRESICAKRYNTNISCVLELNQVWIKKKTNPPFGRDWEEFGEQLLDVFYNYFDEQ